MSNPHKHSRSSSASGSQVRHAPGTSTPFPITSIKFEYPERVTGVGGKPCRVTMGPSSPIRPAMSSRERHEFANSLQRALASLKPKPFTLNVTFKTPPSLVGRTRRITSQRVPSPSFSSSDTLSSADSSKTYSTGFYHDRYALRDNGSIAAISSTSDHY